MAEQLDQMGGEQLRRRSKAWACVYAPVKYAEIVQQGNEARKTMRLPWQRAGGSRFYRLHHYSPRDKLATRITDSKSRAAGGIVINDTCQTSTRISTLSASAPVGTIAFAVTGRTGL